MIMAFVVPGRGGRDVTRAKKLMSAFMRGQGRVPFRPIPSSVFSCFGMGVVATMRVRGFAGGIFVILVLNPVEGDVFSNI
jgi:hypothetical protein